MSSVFMNIHAAGENIVGLNSFLIADGVGEWVSGEVVSTALAEGVAVCGSAAVGLLLGHKLDLGVVEKQLVQVDLTLWITYDSAGGIGHPEGCLGHRVGEEVSKLFVYCGLETEKGCVRELFCSHFLQVGLGSAAVVGIESI